MTETERLRELARLAAEYLYECWSRDDFPVPTHEANIKVGRLIELAGPEAADIVREKLGFLLTDP